MTSAEINREADSLEKRFPEQWSRFYPRVYQDTGCCYVSPKAPAVCLLRGALDFLFDPKLKNDPLYVGEEKEALARSLVYYGMPTYYLAPSLLEAVAHSDLPDGTPWGSIGLPVQAATIMFPRGALSHPLNGSVGFMSYATAMVRLTRWDRARHLFIACVGCCDDAIDTHFDSHYIILEPGNVITRGTLEARMKGDVWRESPAALTDSEGAALQQSAAYSGNLLFRVLAAMEARPGLLSEGHYTGKKLPKGREIWTPNIIGKNYVIKRSSPVPEGSGGWNVRMHWRRGHLRQQPHGPQNTLRKTIWIEPMLVGAEEEESSLAAAV